MAIGITTFALRWAVGTEHFRPTSPLTPLGLLEKAASCGAKVVQICENLRLDRLSDAALSALARRAESLDLTLEVGMCGSRPESLRRHIEVSRQLTAGVLRVVVEEQGWDPPFDEVVPVIRSLAPALRAAGVTVAIENHFSWTPDKVARLVAVIDDPNVGACLDPVNSITRLVGPAEAVSVLAPIAVSAHVKDATTFRRNTGVCVVGCPLGEGFVGVTSMLEMLRRSNRRPNVHVESWMDRLDDEAATVAQEEAWIRKGIDYLRTHA